MESISTQSQENDGLNTPLSNIDTKQKVIDVVSLEREIIYISPSIHFSISELAEKMGNLLYDNLSEYIYLLGSALGRERKSPELKMKFLKASVSITKAWEVCLHNKQSQGLHPQTHDQKICDLFPEVIINKLLDLPRGTLKVFIFRLANKIYNDGLTDECIGRSKLASHLFECSQKLKDISMEL